MTSLLIVDDDAIMRDVLHTMLKGAGYSVDAVDSALGALRALDTRAYDVVLTDLLMAGGDGFDLIAAMRERGHQTRVILMSGDGALSADLQSVISRGFQPDWSLTKPFMRDELIAAIELVMRRKSLPAAS